MNLKQLDHDDLKKNQFQLQSSLHQHNTAFYACFKVVLLLYLVALISTGNGKYHLPQRDPVTAAESQSSWDAESVFSYHPGIISELLLKGSHSFLFSLLNLKRIFKKEHKIVAGIHSSFCRGVGAMMYVSNMLRSGSLKVIS